MDFRSPGFSLGRLGLVRCVLLGVALTFDWSVGFFPSSAAAGEEPRPAASPRKASSSADLEEQIRQLRARLESLEAQRSDEIDKLRQRIALLEEQLRTKEQGAQDERAALVAEAEQATAEETHREAEAAAQRKSFVGHERTLQAMNPEISFLGDISYDWSDSDIQDRFLLRGVEIAFQAPLDPYTRFKGFLAAHEEPPELESDDGEADEEEEHHEHGIGVSVEEAYMEWVALPFHTRLRVGKFRQQFGTLNRWHPHALDSVDMPFALRNAFGHDGLVGLGIGIDWQLPKLWASSNSLTLEVVNADNASAFAGHSFQDPAVLLRHTGFFDLGPNTYFEIGLTGMQGPNDETGDTKTTLGSVDFNFVWEPVQRAKYRNLEIRGEYIHTRFDMQAESAVRSDSFYVYVNSKLSRRWTVGIRYDDAELPWPGTGLLGGAEFSPGLRERAWSPTATFWQSEFVRLRLQYQHTERDFAWAHGPEDDDRLFLQVTFAAGPHKHEAY